MDLGIKGKRALVCASSKGLGRGCAEALAEAGVDLVLNARGTAALEATATAIRSRYQVAVTTVAADITSEEGRAAVLAAAGHVDILVTNAGLRRQTSFLDMSFAEWREILSVALDGAFIVTQAFVPQMIARGGGSIIGLSGISTHIGTPNRAHVSASKAGLEGLMRALAMELAPHGIRANSVAPGAVDTVRGASAGSMPSTLADNGIPLRRRANVAEIADVVRLLAGPEGGYITGQTIHVNGGAFLT